MPTAQSKVVKGNSLPKSANSLKTLADVLASQGALDQKKAEKVKLTEIQTGKSQEEIILKENLVEEKDLVKAKAVLYNIPYIDLARIPVSPEALALLPKEAAARLKVFPIKINPTSRTINIAMADPLNLTAIEFIERKTGYTVKPGIGEQSIIEEFLATRYTSSLAREVTEALKEVSPDKQAVKVQSYRRGRTPLIREEKVAEIVSHILAFAVKARASDVHIEPEDRATRVRYRIDGILQEKLTTPRELHDALISRIKILSGMKIDEKRIPQDGRFNFRSDQKEVDLRVSAIPTSWGEKVVMRILEKSGGIPDLPYLGLRGKALKNLQEAILVPHGIILICGPTGSGKTTTLYSIIQQLNTPKVNIVTLEDPIEYKIVGVNQVQVNPTVGLTFASGLRSFLRQDPNIILVGEIRDEETADLAIQASLTGHLVFSTLHTNDAATALPRLLDMGAEPYLLASSITCIVSQRVLRKVHEDCKKEYTPDEKVVKDIKNVLGNLWQPEKDVKLYKGEGDRECNNTGYYSRVGIFEVMPISQKISRLILEKSPSNIIEKQAIDEGMIDLKQDGYLKVVDGTTTIEEVLRVAQDK